jgi:hypothetical protein
MDVVFGVPLLSEELLGRRDDNGLVVNYCVFQIGCAYEKCEYGSNGSILETHVRHFHGFPVT